MQSYKGILLAALAIVAAQAFAEPPAGYKDVTAYSGSSFRPLVPDDPSKATANASYLNKMIAANVVLYFPAGTYWIDRTITIGKSGVTLWGDEGSVICRTGVPNTCETAFPLGSFNDTANFMVTANNFRMHGLTIMYDVPTSFTGVITAKSSNTATVRLTDGKSASFSADVAISRVNYFDENLRPSGNETFFEAGSKLGISNLSEDENGVKSFKCTLKGSSVGQRVAMACGSNYGQNIIIYSSSASGVQNTVFEDVTVANSFGMVMLVKGATNLTLERFRVDDGDTNTIYTASVDGIHVAALGGKLTMRDCEFNGLADDILNVHCGGPKVGSVSGNTVTFESGVESVYFQRNHTVRFYSSKLAPLGTATVTAVSGSVSGITVDALPSGVAAGCYVANESWLPEVEITGTKVGVTRARGFLLQTDKPVSISDCEFENTRLAGILCAPGASWGEMGPVNGVTVSNCTFRACGAGVASTANNGNAAVVVRCDHDADAATSYGTSVQRDVWIGDCFFEDCPASAVNAVNATGLVVTNNVFLRCGGGVPAQDSCMVRFRRGDGATVVFNTAYGGGFTNDVLNLNSSTHVEAHDNGFRAESEWGGSGGSDGLPFLGTPAVSRDGSGTFSVSVAVSSNAPASVVCVDRGNDYPMATADAGLPATYSAVLSGLAAGTHLPSVRAVASNGTPVSAICPNAFHVGPLAVDAMAAADTGTLAPGVFRVSRADADPTGLPALSFDVAFSGPGLAAVVPPGVSSATIPAGAASVDIPVTPVFSEEQHEALDLVLAVSGASVGQASSATMEVVHTDSDATVRYVAEDGDDANDGVSPLQPKRTVANAVESLAALARTRTCTVRVAPGTYTLTKEDDDPITVTNAIRIVGTGSTPEDVVVRRTNRAGSGTSPTTGRSYQDLSLFHLNHPDALVANLVLHYGSAHQPTGDTTAGSAWIGANGGTISNCVVRGGRVSHPNATTPGILMLGPGLVTHCVITNNSGTSAMESSWAKTSLANAVAMKGTGGRLENCLIRDNRSEAEGGTGSDKTSTIYATGSATLSNCTIVENRARNCAGVFADGTGVTVRNCVLAGNVDVGAAADNPNWMGTGSFAACATDDAEPVNEACFSGSLVAFFPRLAEDVPVALKFRPAAGGPLCDRGVDYEPMAGVDLSGVQPRKIGAHVDIGCCEADPGSPPIVVPVLATRADDGTDPLGFGTDPSDDSPTFEVTIRNAAGGVWYTVYAADEVGGTYKAAADSVQAESDGLLTLSIPAPSSVPARFVRIGASDSPVSGGTEL